jgi:hypothetical protein
MRRLASAALGLGESSSPSGSLLIVDGRLVTLLGDRVAVVSFGSALPRQWCCYACGAHGTGDDILIELATLAHLHDCDGSLETAAARIALVSALAHESSESAAGHWSPTLVLALLLEGGLWTFIADKIGWPVGQYGLDGWDCDLDSVLTRYGTDRKDIFTFRNRNGEQ